MYSGHFTVVDDWVFRFIDGDSYFSAVADALEEAQEEIFISDWW